jgi:hypothetical protein
MSIERTAFGPCVDLPIRQPKGEIMSEYTKHIRDNWGNAYTVKVNKIGGGTVGHVYQGEYWDVVIVDSDGTTVWNSMGFRSQGLRIGRAVTHEDAAYEAFGWYEDTLPE